MEYDVWGVKRCRNVKVRASIAKVAEGGTRVSQSRACDLRHRTLYGMCAPYYGRMTGVVAGRLCLPVSSSVIRIPIA